MTTNKRALVTGGNRGIGFAIAQGLIDLNYEVIITARLPTVGYCWGKRSATANARCC
jgi:NAD(P)-dependent dehydrogenase (short-subunit alcohol dehydrogenase family)